MLPIAARRKLRIPHGLAALAAAFCLVMAFSTDFAERERAVMSTQFEPPGTVVAGTTEEPRTEPAAGTDPHGERLGRESHKRHPTQPLPWFPGLRLGGG